MSDKYIQAMGYLSGLVPSMPIEVNNPIGMAETIYQTIVHREAELRSELAGMTAQKAGADRALARAMEELTDARSETEAVRGNLAFAHSEWEKDLIERNDLRAQLAEAKAALARCDAPVKMGSEGSDITLYFICEICGNHGPHLSRMRLEDHDPICIWRKAKEAVK